MSDDTYRWVINDLRNTANELPDSEIKTLMQQAADALVTLVTERHVLSLSKR